MKDLKLLFSISKSFIGDIWYILFFVFLFSLSISFYNSSTITFASWSTLTPSFDFNTLFNVPQIESIDEFKILDLKNFLEKLFLFFSNNVFEDQPTTIEFLYFIIPLFLVVVFFIAILNFFSKSFVYYANAKLVFSMRKKLISIIDLDFRYYKIFSSGRLFLELFKILDKFHYKFYQFILLFHKFYFINFLFNSSD